MDFDWDAADLDHIARHDIGPDEVEDALSDPAAVPAQAYREGSGAVRAAIIGQTEGGRYLFIVFMRRAGRIRVVTAREATASEKRRHRR